jgi:outer membrane lipoprotein-sorting protein
VRKTVALRKSLSGRLVFVAPLLEITQSNFGEIMQIRSTRRRLFSALTVLTLGALLASSTSLRASQDAKGQQPTGEQVIDKYIEVTGGRAAYEKVKTRVTHGKMTIPAQGMAGTIEIYSKAPNLFYLMVEIPGTEKQENVYNGKLAWEKSVLKGTRLVTGQELESLKQQANMAGDLKWRDTYTSIENEGVVDIDGKKCYKLTLTPKTGKPELRFYDTQTGLLARAENTVEMMGTTVHSIATPSDYREFEGVKMPFKTSVSIALGGMQLEQNIEVEKIENNVDIPDSKFEMPEDVKELVKKQAATKPDDEKGK